MKAIKSENAQQILDNAWTSVGATVWKVKAEEAVIIAETEAEERHAKELQSLKDEVIKAIQDFTQKLNEQ